MASVLADFVGYISAESPSWDDPVEGRIVLGKEQLVLGKSESKRETIPLQSVFDVNVGEKPKMFDPMPGTPVTIAYNDGMNRVAAVVATEDGTIRKFVTVLFKTLLNGTEATIKHPAKVGGRVVDSEYRGAILSLQSGTVQFETEDGPVGIELDSVIDFEQVPKTFDSEQEKVLSVEHMDTGTAMTTVMTTESSRRLSILGRYLQRTYQKVLASLSSLSLSDPETETLTTIYSAGDMDVSLESVIDMDPDTIKSMLQALHEEGLIESGENAPVLTARGQIVVNHYLERVNN